MAQTFFPDASEVIEMALIDIGAIDPEGGLEPTAAMQANALNALNYLVTSWQGHGMQVWCRKKAQTALIDGGTQYTIGAAGANLETNGLPVDVIAGYLFGLGDSSMERVVLEQLSKQQYDELYNHTIPEGRPTSFYYDPTTVTTPPTQYGSIYVWPTPTAADAAKWYLQITYTKPIQDFAADSDTLDFPQEWFNAVRWNLAYQLCFQYEVPLGKMREIKELARETLSLALSADREETPVRVAPAQE